MEVRNCRKCRRLFNYLGGKNICPACRDELEMTFIKVRDYIRENPNSNLQQIADDNEIEVQQLRDWVKEGRLELSMSHGMVLKCEKCGKAIATGRFCEECNKRLADNLGALVAENTKAKAALEISDEPGGPRMHFRK